jgi:hypothetical protein
MFKQIYQSLFAPRTEALGFVRNDGGRRAAGFQGEAGDCVVRAIAIAAQRPYLEVYEALRNANAYYAEGRTSRLAKHIAVRGSSPRNGNHRTVFHDYILSLGFEWVPTMAVGQGCQVHLRQHEIPAGRLIVKVSKHLSAVIDGVIHDTHNPARGGTRCVYGYYIQKR